MIKILITGSNGFLGSNLVRFFTAEKEYDVFATSYHQSSFSDLNNFVRGDLLDATFVDKLVADIKPDIVINTVSMVNVDDCEEKPQLAHALTVRTAENLAKSVKRCGSRLIYISTDHLFDGNRSMYSEEDKPAPVNIYGKMKMEAESRTLEIHYDTAIVRTNFYGWSHALHPPTFGEWVFNSLKNQIPINLFTDYYFTPIEVTYLAQALEKVAKSDYVGVINIAGSQRCSKYDFGMALAKIFNLDPTQINPVKIKPNSFKVRRQKDLSLSTEKFKRIFNQDLPNLREGLQRFYEKSYQ